MPFVARRLAHVGRFLATNFFHGKDLPRMSTQPRGSTPGKVLMCAISLLVGILLHYSIHHLPRDEQEAPPNDSTRLTRAANTAIVPAVRAHALMEEISGSFQRKGETYISDESLAAFNRIIASMQASVERAEQIYQKVELEAKRNGCPIWNLST